MTADEIAAAVRAAIERVVPDADLSGMAPTDDLIDALELDSMDALTIAEEIHASTGVEIPERDYPKLRTLDQFVTYLAAARP
jgi:acyl carrier protein